MKRLIASALMLFPMMAAADYYKLRKVPAHLKPPSFDRGRAAALEIPSVGGEFGCSATVISNQGHVLTALHCLPQCVKFKEGKSVKNFRFTVPDHDQVRAGKANCRLPFAHEGKSLGDELSQIVAVGAGYVYAVDFENLEEELKEHTERQAIFSQLIESGVGITGDYAILRVPGLAGRTCVKTSGRGALISETVWNIGYPSKRSGAAFSAGKVIYAPVGKVDAKVTSAEQARSLVTRRTGAVISTIEAHKGSSGSGMISYGGDLVGVLNAAAGSSFGASIAYVISTATANYGSSVVANAFNCQ